MSSSFMFRDGSSAPQNVVGVINFQGTGPFKAYFDDFQIGTASYWSCDGWDSSSCPFNPANTAMGEGPGRSAAQAPDKAFGIIAGRKGMLQVRPALPVDFSLTVYDCAGRTVWSQKVANGSTHTRNVAFAQKNGDGILVAELRQGERTVQKKIMAIRY
jgi:hypothetical protein